MAIVPDASAASLHPFIAANVEAGATVVTDGWPSYSGIEDLGYVRDRRSQRAARLRGDDAFALLPAVHRVASLAKRWLLGTHQGSVEDAHLQAYLDELVFRFNRRTSRSRGLVFHRLMQLAVGPRPGPVPRPHRRQATQAEAATRRCRVGASAVAGSASREPSLESRLTRTGPLKWILQSRI